MQQQRNISTAAVSWTLFASIMMVVTGVWWFTAGLVTLFNDDFYVQTPNYLFRLDLTTWGVVHIVIGVLAVAAAAGLFRGAVWARTTGVVMAVLAALVAFAWLPWYPLWGVLIIASSVFVIWALTTHGRDITDSSV